MFSVDRREPPSQLCAKSSLQTIQSYVCPASCLTSTTMSDSHAVINATQTRITMELPLPQLTYFPVGTANVLARILSSSWVWG